MSQAHIEYFTFPVIDITGEFTEEFLKLWKWWHPPIILHYQFPYRTHIVTCPEIKYILEEGGGAKRIMLIELAYDGFMAQRFKKAEYRTYIKTVKKIPYALSAREQQKAIRAEHKVAKRAKAEATAERKAAQRSSKRP